MRSVIGQSSVLNGSDCTKISIICFHMYGVYLIRVRRYAGVDSAFLVKSDSDWDP